MPEYAQRWIKHREHLVLNFLCTNPVDIDFAYHNLRSDKLGNLKSIANAITRNRNLRSNGKCHGRFNIGIDTRNYEGKQQKKHITSKWRQPLNVIKKCSPNQFHICRNETKFNIDKLNISFMDRNIYREQSTTKWNFQYS